MNTTLPKSEAPDDLDRMFSDFFKAQLKHPWPNAPIPAAGAATGASEPSALVNARAEAPRNTPAPAPQAKGRDGTARARFTLAASVALALGACWALSNDFQPGERTNGFPTAPAPGLLPGSGAEGNGHPTLDTMQEHRAKEPPPVIPGGALEQPD